MTSFIKFPSGKSLCLNLQDFKTLSQLHIHIQDRVEIPASDYYLVRSGRRVCGIHPIEDGATFHVVPRLLGGKGGFGSMLRAIGAQIEKTTNREACRDLSGRRMRDVNNEKKLREWVSKKADREKEREERRRQKMERRRSEPRHTFSDPVYEDQKRKVIDDLDDALQEGLKNAGASSSTSSSLKRHSEEPDSSSAKKARGWYGEEFDSDGISDDSSDTEMMAQPGPSGSQSDSPSTSQSEEKHSDSDTQGDMDTESSAPKEAVDKTNSQMESEKKEETEQKNIPDKESLEKSTAPSDNHPESDPDQKPTDKQDTEPTTEKGDIPSTKATEATSNKSEVPVEIDLSQYSSAEALEEVGLEALKAALMARGLKCGGALTERAARLFSVKGLSKDEINPSLFSKGGKIKGKGKK